VGIIGVGLLILIFWPIINKIDDWLSKPISDKAKAEEAERKERYKNTKPL